MAEGSPCPTCGAPLKAESAFCAACGTPRQVEKDTVEVKARPPRRDVPGQVPGSSRMSFRPWIVLLVLLLGGACALLVSYRHRDRLLPATIIDDVHAGPATDLATAGVKPLQPIEDSRASVPDAVVLCRGVDAQGAPIDPTSTFAPSQTFFCSFHFSHLQVGERLALHWQHGGQEVRTTRYVSDVSGPANVYFRLVPARAWPVGRYGLDLEVEGQSVAQRVFDVDARAAASEASPAPVESDGVVAQAVLCRGLGKNYEPVDPTTTFAPDQSLHCSLLVKQGRQGQEFKLRWYNDHQLMQETAHALSKDIVRGYLGFTLTAHEGWKPGPYQAEVDVDGRPVRRLSFQVAP